MGRGSVQRFGIYHLPAGDGFIGFFAGISDALCANGDGGDGLAVQGDGDVIVALVGIGFELSHRGETSFRHQDPRPAGAVHGIQNLEGAYPPVGFADSPLP